MLTVLEVVEKFFWMYKTKNKCSILQLLISNNDFTSRHLAEQNQTNTKSWVKKISVRPLNLNFFFSNFVVLIFFGNLLFWRR